jgi:hypothetical protein
MLTTKLRLDLARTEWRNVLSQCALLGLYLLMTVQFIGCYLFLGHPYIHLDRFGYGHERLPFQTRLLLAPLFRWAQSSTYMANLAADWSKNQYFFPHGIGPGGIVEFYLDVPCVLIAGWAAVRIYRAASRRHLLEWLVYPLFLVLCTVTYILHVVQNYRFIYDMPSLMFFALGLYLIYFRKPVLWLVALFAVATLNRETTLLLIPFFVLSACVRPGRLPRPERAELHQGSSTGHGPLLAMRGSPGFQWRRALRPRIAVPALLMLAYWAVWHVFIFHLFRHNPSEYYSRIGFNWYSLRRLRYYPQLFSACGYLLPLLVLYRKKLNDAQLRIWMWMIPVWYALMVIWGILVETRVFGELLPFIACAGTLIAEESLATAIERRRHSESDEVGRTNRLRAA